MYLFAILAWIKLGNFPIPTQDDPKELKMNSLLLVIWYGMFFWAINAFTWVILLISSLFYKTKVKKEIFIFIIGLFLVYIQFHFDLFSLIEWIYD